MLEYEVLENIKTDCVNIVVFNMLEVKQSKFFGTPGRFINEKYVKL